MPERHREVNSSLGEREVRVVKVLQRRWNFVCISKDDWAFSRKTELKGPPSEGAEHAKVKVLIIMTY